MVTLYIYTGLGDADQLEALAALLEPHFPTKRLAVMEEVEQALLGERRAVVIFSPEKPEAARIQAQLSRFRNLLAPTACVVVLPEEPGKDAPDELLALDVAYLSNPVSPFTALSQVSQAVRHAELLSTLDDCSQLDEVTSLYNRNYFIKRLSEEISLSRRHLSPLSCVVIGINYYKIFLDSYGHDFINRLLSEAAQGIQQHTRHEDLIARIGDEEIGLLLPRSSEKGAKVLTDRIVEHLNGVTLSHAGGEEQISVCAGIAGFPLPNGEMADADTLIRYSRHALHNARCNTDEDINVQLFSAIQPAL